MSLYWGQGKDSNNKNHPKNKPIIKLNIFLLLKYQESHLRLMMIQLRLKTKRKICTSVVDVELHLQTLPSFLTTRNFAKSNPRKN